nr:lipoyl synthase [Candidatus Sulfidibacterium hydrothermale]
MAKVENLKAMEEHHDKKSDDFIFFGTACGFVINLRFQQQKMNTSDTILRKPDWLKIKIPSGKEYLSVKEIVERNKLHTICTSGHCPNMHECWGRGTATLMILGDICTRSCKFCNVKTGKPLPVDHDEPRRVAESVKRMKLKHVVLTSVDRDDLPDGGAAIWAETVRKIKEQNPETTIETLIPDFDGHEELIQQVIDAGPEVISHNLETVRRLTPETRSRAKYDRSLQVLQYIAGKGVVAKSGIMAGLGETPEEVFELMDDLLDAGVSVLTIGQYLQPTKKHLPVKEYVTPEQFEIYRKTGLKKGFRYVESSPLVRSSYHAEKHISAR